ncbi:MAG TPA: DUF4062 domain-containing protein [Ramlibacter sp.]|uniref:DUF4062 domain-containing protein n=1 Tax=Ramlibacter sp. TaxID=1917967 RepID=UPI002ED3CF73
MKIFVSSLISGFEALRAAARSAILALGHEPVMAEDFGAKSISPQVACLQGLRSADLVVLILGERYGALPPGSQVSPTHEEYLEARGAKEILLFVQEGVTPEPAQAALLREAQGWRGGLFRAGFRSPEELRDAVTRAIHKFELAHAAAPLNASELRQTASAMLTERVRDDSQGRSRVRFSLAAGPKQQVLRPAELEAESLVDAVHQYAMFGATKLFDRSSGVEVRMNSDTLVIKQENGASLQLDEQGGVAIALPLEREASRSRGFSGVMLGIVEESVLRELTNAIAFADWVLDKIDPTQRVTHVALAARIESSDFMAWRTQAEQDANPNSGTMRMSPAPEKPVCADCPRGALKFDARRLAEDLLVPLRRQWKA